MTLFKHRLRRPQNLINRKSYVQPLEGDIVTKINKTIIYLVRCRRAKSVYILLEE